MLSASFENVKIIKIKNTLNWVFMYLYILPLFVIKVFDIIHSNYGH